MVYPAYITSTKTTSADYLYSALGSFWTSLFSEKDTLRGYTLGQAEEITQRYLDFIEVVSSFAIDETPLFHKVNWQPLTLYKSQLSRVNFVFEENEATFGPQDSSDPIYQGVTFRFGRDKQPSAEVYTYQPTEKIHYAGVIADKILQPTKLLNAGVDYKIEENIFYFNVDPFTLGFPTSQVVNEDGAVVTFTDIDGETKEDERLILWLYSADLDTSIVYNNFGAWLINLPASSTDGYKKLISSLMKIAVNGPTMYQLTLCLAAALEIPVVTQPEVVESVFLDGYAQYVVTDKTVHKVKNEHTIKDTIVAGYNLKKGELLTTNLSIYDSLSRFPGKAYTNSDISSGWWVSSELTGGLFNLSKYLFFGEYLFQLAFSTSLELVTLNAEGDIVFPVSGAAEDVQTFNGYLNQEENKEKLKEVFNLVSPGDTYPLIPFIFVMENFLKNNTVLMTLDFADKDDHVKILSLLPELAKYLPPYCYCVYKLRIEVARELVNNFSNCTSITFDSGTQLLNCDGTNEDGTIEKLAPYNYTSITQRLFELAREIIVRADEDLYKDYVVCGIPLIADDPTSEAEAIDVVETLIPAAAVTEKRFVVVSEGRPLVEIPEGVTTAGYPSLLLLDFS